MSTSQQADPLIGRLVDGRYRVRARIARGGMATVYVATDLRLERRIALKVMHGHLSDDTVFQSRFIQEARAAARLADPHVVNVFDQGQDADLAYLVMEYLPGITLRELLREQRRLTIPQTITIMDAVLAGLAAAHRAGIVHRDVKPENILLADDGRIKIGDFGLARATSANTATGAQLLGTIAYLAPELVTRGTADARSDIYALGIMLYEMLTGEQPYKGEQPMQIAFQHATDSVPRPSVRNPGVPEQLDELVLWSTEKNPDDRPVDARAMLDRFREIERELGIHPQVARAVPIGVIHDEGGAQTELTKVIPSAVTGPLATIDDVDNAAQLRVMTKRRARRGGWLTALVVLLAALAALIGWWFGSGPGSLVLVADVTGKTFEEASTRLAQDSLVAVQQTENSLEVPADQIIRTDPASGALVDRDATVDVYVSLGPAAATFTALNGQTETDVRALLAAQQISAGDSAQYYTEGAASTVVYVVVHPAAGGEDVECGDGCTVHQGDTATLGVSLGPLPSVIGVPVDEATKTLADHGITVTGTTQEYSDSVATGDVISMADRDPAGWWRSGDSTTLVVSKGPAPVTVPTKNVIGATIRTAVKTLENLGFKVDPGIADSPIIFSEKTTWDVYTVASTDPAAGASAPRGATIKLQPKLF